MFKKNILIIIIIHLFKAYTWNDIEKGFISKKSNSRKFDSQKIYELLSEFDDRNLKLNFFIKILTTNFEIETNPELAVNYYQSLYKKKTEMSVRVDAKSFINFEYYELLQNSVVDTDDLESDVTISISQFENLKKENLELEKLFFDFLRITYDDNRFAKLGFLLAEYILNYPEIKYTDVIYLIYLFMERNQQDILFHFGKFWIEGNDVKFKKKNNNGIEKKGVNVIKSYFVDKLKNNEIDEETRSIVNDLIYNFKSKNLLAIFEFFKTFISTINENDILKGRKVVMLLIYSNFTQFNASMNDFHWVIDYHNSKSTLISEFNSENLNYEKWYKNLFKLLLDGMMNHSLYNMYYYDDFTKISTKLLRAVRGTLKVIKIIVGYFFPIFRFLFGAIEIFEHYYEEYITLYNYDEDEYYDLKIDNVKNRIVGHDKIHLINELKRMTVMTENYSDNYLATLFTQLNQNFKIESREIKGSVLLIPKTKTYVTFVPRKLDLMAVAKNWKTIENDIRLNWLQGEMII